MGKFARLLAVLLVAVFAAATLGAAAGATAMTVEMALADSGDGGGCYGCAGDDGMLLSCDQACVTSLPALPATAAVTDPAVAEAFAPAAGGPLVSWTWPPDPSPPRFSS